MKKLMTATIIILPLLVLAILLVSGAVLSLVTHIYVESVEFSKKDSIVLLMDDDNAQTRDITDEINVFPVNAKNRGLIFKSSNEDVATVSDDGIITPVYYGQAYITVQSSENSAAIDKRKVVVTGSKVHDFVLSGVPEGNSMTVGESAQLAVSIFPVHSLNKAQKWESDNPEVLRVNANGTVTAVGVGQATITVTSLDNDQISQTVKINCHPKTEEGFNVSCAGTKVEDGKTYKTILDNLNFEAANGNKSVLYQLDDSGSWQTVVGKSVNIDLSQNHKVSFKCEEQTISFELEKVPFSEFGLDISATIDTDDGAEKMALDSLESAGDKKEVDIVLARNVQDGFTLQVNLGENFLGGFGSDENFEELLAVDFGEAEGYSASYDSLNSQIIVSFPGLHNFKQDATLKFAEKEVGLKLNRVAVSQVEFANEAQSFDNANTADIYKGYQQVTVYAKHSFYGTSADDGNVDYFKIPFKAMMGFDGQTLVSADEVAWKLSRFVGNENMGVLTSQKGDTVTIGEKEYKIVKDGEEYVLKDAQNLDGEAISGKGGLNEEDIIWVDPFTEPGFARIYFGNFAGLKETDVQNDYFGNFADNSNWSRPDEIDDDGSGRDFHIHEGNSFAFLRVEAGDGAVGGENCHFNFNVLDDDSLVNVFNAAGYYKNDKVVLQSNFYGVGEIGEDDKEFDKATKNGLFLTEVEGLGKTLIYGNGYQVNFQAKNDAMGGYSESDGITVEKAYNAIIKCSNPVETISKENQRMVLKMTYAYYCNLSYYYKFNPNGKIFYTKNTVFSGISEAAVQLYYNETLYAENIVMVECSAGIMADSPTDHDVKIYFKDAVDILDYANATQLANMNSLIMALYDSVAGNVKEYFEWHGQEASASVYSFGGDVDRFYVNVLAFTVTDLSGKTFVWDENDNQYKKISEGATLSNGSKIVSKELAFGTYFALTYEVLDEDGLRLDDATVNMKGTTVTAKAGVGSLFTDEQYIRLLCEYETKGVKNEAHILWHMQQAYRDTSLIEGRNLDHVDNLKSTLMNKGLQWPDGTHPEDDWVENVAQSTQVFVLPERKRDLVQCC